MDSCIPSESLTFPLSDAGDLEILDPLKGFRGYEEEDVGSLNLRLAEVANGPVYQFAVQRDALVESSTIRSVRRRSPDAIAGLAGSILSAQGQQGQ